MTALQTLHKIKHFVFIHNYTQASILCDKTESINNSGFNQPSALLDTCLSKHSQKLNPRFSIQKSSPLRCEQNTMASNHRLLNCYSNSLTPKRLLSLHKISFRSLFRSFLQLIHDINLTIYFNIPNDQDVKLMYRFNLDKGCPNRRLENSALSQKQSLESIKNYYSA